MTTQHERLREAFEKLHGQCPKQPKDVYEAQMIERWQARFEDFQQGAAFTIASAQSDAGKGFEKYICEKLAINIAPPNYNPVIENGIAAHETYHAGHAQGYAAGLAAQEAKVKELEKFKLGAEEELKRQRLTIANLNQFLSPDFWYWDADDATGNNIENLICDVRIHAEDMRAIITALATAKADALELANEVRRCHALAQDADDRICEGDVAGFALFGDACHEMIDDRPDTVTAAMGRYK
jgi:hypothetical protein